MTNAQAAGTKASIIKLVLQLEEEIERLNTAKSNISEEEMRVILEDEIKEATYDALEAYTHNLTTLIDREISFSDLKELITGRIEL